MEFIRPDGLVDTAKLGLILAEGKQPLAQVQPTGELEKHRLQRRLPQRKCRTNTISATRGKAATIQANVGARGQSHCDAMTLPSQMSHGRKKVMPPLA
jgi:hypothetical protein